MNVKMYGMEGYKYTYTGQLDEWDGRDSNTYDSATFSVTELTGFNSGEFACWDLGYVRLQTDSIARHSSCWHFVVRFVRVIRKGEGWP